MAGAECKRWTYADWFKDFRNAPGVMENRIDGGHWLIHEDTNREILKLGQVFCLFSAFLHITKISTVTEQLRKSNITYGMENQRKGLRHTWSHLQYPIIPSKARAGSDLSRIRGVVHSWGGRKKQWDRKTGGNSRMEYRTTEKKGFRNRFILTPVAGEWVYC